LNVSVSSVIFRQKINISIFINRKVRNSHLLTTKNFYGKDSF
jgi:hypothetical protein